MSEKEQEQEKKPVKKKKKFAPVLFGLLFLVGFRISGILTGKVS